MKKTALSLVISFLIVNSYTPAFASEGSILPLPSFPFQNQDREQLSNSPPQNQDGDQSLNNSPQNQNNSYPSKENTLSQYPQYLNDFGLSQDQFETFNADDIANINPDVFGAFKADDFTICHPK
jgi:hypothetical protein